MLIKPGAIDFRYVKISSLFEIHYCFPIFQRFYCWKDKQINEIISDLDEALDNPNKQIYLLDFIWYEEEGVKYIADGQQRMITLNLLFLNINQIIDDKKIKADKIPLFDLSYDWPDYNDKYLSCISEYPRAPFKKVYLSFKQWLDSRNNNDIIKIRDILVDRTYVYMREVAGADTAFAIFSQINTGGKPLSKDDIIKTTIDKYSEDYEIRVNYNSKKASSLTKAVQGYFKNKRNSSDPFDTINIVDFLKKDIVPTKEKFEEFANYINIAINLEKYPIYKIVEYVSRTQLTHILYSLALRGIDPKSDSDYVQHVMLPLCLLSIVMTTKGSNPGGIITSLYDNIIKLIKEDKSCMQIQNYIVNFINNEKETCTISYNEFVEGLSGTTKVTKRAKEAILIMDVIRSSKSSIIDMEKINLEHIYPERPAIVWSTYGWPTNHDDIKVLNNNIGNFMLLNKKINDLIKNKYLDVKVPEYEKMLKGDLALQTDMNKVDYKRFEEEKGHYIFERQKYIAEIVYNEFELAQVMIKKEYNG